MLIESESHKALTATLSSESFVADYERKIGFSKAPFSSLPKRKFLFQHESAIHVANTVAFSLKAGESAVKIVGEKGVGKTFLLQQIVSALGDDFYVMQNLDSSASPIDFLKSIVEEFGVTYSVSATNAQLLKQIQCLLYEHYSKTDYPIVMWVDDAQNLPLDTFKTIELLCELQTHHRKLIHFIFSGTEKLNVHLAHESIKQLRHHIVHSEKLKPLSKKEMLGYIEQRLNNSGAIEGVCFTPAAVSLLYRKTRGIPRVINFVANKALLLAHGKGEKIISKSSVFQAASECDWIEPEDDKFLLYFFYIPLFLAAFGAITVFMFDWLVT